MKRQVSAITTAALVALVVGSEPAAAQADSVRQVTSTRRIPVRKDQPTAYTRTSAGEVDLLSTERARIDSLYNAAAADRARLQSIEASLAAATAKTDELGRSVSSLQDSLRIVRGELSTASMRVAALQDSVVMLDQRMSRWAQRWNAGSIFGNSGFYVGLGSGANFTMGTLKDIGYSQGLNVVVPVGYHKRGTALGFRAELGVETFDGQNFGGFSNADPKAYTAVGLVTLHLPFNQAKTHNFYLMGGAGAHMFKNIESSSTISARLGNPSTNTSGDGKRDETKIGVTGGAGLEFHVLGATSVFVQTRLTNLMADAPAGGTGSKNLRWVPLTIGFQLR